MILRQDEEGSFIDLKLSDLTLEETGGYPKEECTILVVVKNVTSNKLYEYSYTGTTSTVRVEVVKFTQYTLNISIVTPAGASPSTERSVMQCKFC